MSLRMLFGIAAGEPTHHDRAVMNGAQCPAHFLPANTLIAIRPR
jgi:hypothetical protein